MNQNILMKRNISQNTVMIVLIVGEADMKEIFVKALAIVTKPDTIDMIELVESTEEGTIGPDTDPEAEK